LKNRIITALLLALGIALYGYFAHELDFTQDDAYISYRYVENFLNGHGLVYNLGERVEGFTNFGWVVYLLFWGALGADYLAVSKITGLVMGAAILLMTLLIARRLFDRKNWPFVWLAVFLVAANQSLAYWSPAGLETAAFALAAVASLYLYLCRSYVLTLALIMGVLIRPEGVLVVFIILVIEAVHVRGWPVFSLRCAALAFIFCLPLAGFKLAYYHSLFPNPFYAKTGFTVEQLSDGLEYAALFLGHYGFYGFGLVVPLVFWRKATRELRAIWIFTILYGIYIVVVGGDVLKVHRFFVPLLGTSAALVAGSIWLIVRRLSTRNRLLVTFVVAVPLLYFTVTLPRDHVLQYNNLERRFADKMSFMADNLAASDSTAFSVALPTIGIFGYKLCGHRIIDMVGLTDSTIARHSEAPIEGMASTWKERKHNTAYLLGQEPDYILFSTGKKPSAPAEKALLLYRQFQDCYRVVGWHEPTQRAGSLPVIRLIFKRFRPVEGELRATYPLDYVEYYKLGMESYVVGDFHGAIRWYRKAMEVSPDPPYIYVPYNLGLCHLLLNDTQTALDILESVVERDSLVFLANVVLYKHAMVTGQTEKAQRHWYWLEVAVPWLLPQVKAETAELLGNTESRQP